ASNNSVTRILSGVLLVSALACGQLKTLTVCGLHDPQVHSGDRVEVRAELGGGHFHGYYLLDPVFPEPCPGSPSHIFVKPPYAGLGFSSQERMLAVSPMLAAWENRFRPRSVVMRVNGTVYKKTWPVVLRTLYPMFTGP